jgi:hypothetical protein
LFGIVARANCLGILPRCSNPLEARLRRPEVEHRTFLVAFGAARERETGASDRRLIRRADLVPQAGGLFEVAPGATRIIHRQRYSSAREGRTGDKRLAFKQLGDT